MVVNPLLLFPVFLFQRASRENREIWLAVEASFGGVGGHWSPLWSGSLLRAGSGEVQ